MSTEWITPLEWNNAGAEPSDVLKKEGFKPEYKPAADTFNYFLNKGNQCIKQLQTEIDKRTAIVEATSVDGVTYTATVPSISELYDGLEITIIPNMNNTTDLPRLKIEGVGDNGVRLALSFNCAATDKLKPNFLSAGRPVKLKYHANCNLGIQGQGAWIFADRQKTSAQDLYGIVPVDGGGTGANNGEEACANIGAAYVGGEWVNVTELMGLSDLRSSNYRNAYIPKASMPSGIYAFKFHYFYGSPDYEAMTAACFVCIDWEIMGTVGVHIDPFMSGPLKLVCGSTSLQISVYWEEWSMMNQDAYCKIYMRKLF